MHHAHYPAMIISLIVAGLGILLASIMYLKKMFNPDKISNAVPWLYRLSLNKWYFDEIYDVVFVTGTLVLSKFLAWFDSTIVDGVVNGAASVTHLISRISGLFDSVVVDGIVNLVATLNGIGGLIIRKIQTGKVQSYLVMVIFSIVILLFIFI